MRKLWPIFFACSFGLVVDTSAADERRFGELEALVIRPENLPKPCDFIWVTPPHPLNQGEDKDLLEHIWEFWFSEAANELHAAVVIGFSTMYDSPYGKSSADPREAPLAAITVLGVLMNTTEHAAEIERVLKSRFVSTIESGEFKLFRKDRKVVWLALNDELTKDRERCIGALARVIEAKL